MKLIGPAGGAESRIFLHISAHLLVLKQNRGVLYTHSSKYFLEFWPVTIVIITCNRSYEFYAFNFQIHVY